MGDTSVLVRSDDTEVLFFVSEDHHRRCWVGDKLYWVDESDPEGSSLWEKIQGEDAGGNVIHAAREATSLANGIAHAGRRFNLRAAYVGFNGRLRTPDGACVQQDLRRGVHALTLTKANTPRRLDESEAEVALAERLVWSPAMSTVMDERALVFGAQGWHAPGVGLWRDRERAEVVGRRWDALAFRTANGTARTEVRAQGGDHGK
jgi:hypothetical protein